MRRVLALFVVLLGLSVGSMSAAATVQPAVTPVTTTITLTGILTSGRDYVGYFGPWGRNLAGKSFTAVYNITTFANSSIGSGMDVISLGSTPAGPTTISFGITINGHTQTGTANSFGSVETEDGVGGLFGGGFDRLQTAVLERTTTGSYVRTFDMSATIQSFVNNFVTDRSLNAIPSFTHMIEAGDYVTGRFQIGQNMSPSVLSYGVMSINRISVASSPEYFATSPVPEPGEWAMMLAGLAVVAATAHRRRR